MTRRLAMLCGTSKNLVSMGERGAAQDLRHISALHPVGKGANSFVKPTHASNQAAYKEK